MGFLSSGKQVPASYGKLGVDCQVENAVPTEDAEGHINLRVISPERIEGTNVESESPKQHPPLGCMVQRVLNPHLPDPLESVFSLLALPSPSPAPQTSFHRMAPSSVSSLEPGNVIGQPPAETSPSNLGDLIPTLKSLRVSQTWHGHMAILRDIQFSLDGKYRRLSPTRIHHVFCVHRSLVASCAWDKTAVIWKINSDTGHSKLAYPQESPGQVQWSPNGKHLLVKSASGLSSGGARCVQPVATKNETDHSYM